MAALDDARSHLDKAEEFVQAAQVNLDLGLFNAATSNAVSSGINSKDAICLTLTGVTMKNDDHQQAMSELKASGPAGAALASTLQRLLALKNKSQYRTTSVTRPDATKATEWARRLYEGAKEIASA